MNGDGKAENLPDFVNNSLTLRACYEKHSDLKKFKVTYYDHSNLLLEQDYVEGDAFKPIGPSKAGYIFIGWDLNSDGKPDVLPTKVTSNLTLFACYVDSSTNTNCVISFYNGTELLGSENVRLGTAYLTQATVNREGYEFIGWDYNGDNTSDEFPIIITGNLSLYACYKKIEIEVIEHTISYYFDGELLGTKKYVEGKA